MGILDKDAKRKKEQIYCGQLGCVIPFSYCMEPAQKVPCRRIVDCWWQVFDVMSYLEERLPEETLRILHDRSQNRPGRLDVILDQIDVAKKKRQGQPDGV